MNVYLVYKDSGYSKVDPVAIMPDKEKALEYARLLGSGGVVQTFELLDEVPEHWTVWTAHVELFADGRQQNPGIYLTERTYWEDDDFAPVRYPSIKVLYRYTHDYSNVRPMTFDELLNVRAGFSYREEFAPQPELEPNTWSIWVESLNKDEAERLARERYDALKAKWIEGENVD